MDLTAEFEAKRSHLYAVALRMLGSAVEAEDAVQEAWLRLHRSDVAAVENLGGWLTTVTARVCLDLLRSRKSRAAVPPVEEGRVPDASHDLAVADSVAAALLVVLETLAPAERVAFVLHDLFDVGFDEIGRVLDRSEAATRQLASRARRRVQRREGEGGERGERGGDGAAGARREGAASGLREGAAGARREGAEGARREGAAAARREGAEGTRREGAEGARREGAESGRREGAEGARRGAGAEGARRAGAEGARRGERAEGGRAARGVVDAFLVAARTGDLAGLLAVLDPDVVVRADERAVRAAAASGWAGPELAAETRGAARVAALFDRRASGASRATIDGEPGAAWVLRDRPRTAFVFTFVGERIAAIDLVMEPAALDELAIEIL